jgi:hypothetical protein
MGVKRPGGKADRSPPSSAEVKNAWSYTSTPSIRLHGVVLCSAQGQLCHRNFNVVNLIPTCPLLCKVSVPLTQKYTFIHYLVSYQIHLSPNLLPEGLF